MAAARDDGATEASIPLEGLAHASGIWKLDAGRPRREAEWRQFLHELLACQFQTCLSEGCLLVGHVKAHLGTPSGALKGSIVHDRSGPRIAGSIESPSPTATLTVNCVTYGLGLEVVRRIVDACLISSMESHGMHSPTDGRKEREQ